MVKKSGRKTKGSAKAETPSSANPDEKVAKPPVPRPADQKKSSTHKKSEIACQFCHKPMKDDKTRKVHERNCKSKQSASSPPQKDRFESAILELKDHFNDEVMSMSKTLQEREEHHQRELDEVKTVLRMEIDRHSKELERMGKAEKEAPVNEPAASGGQVPAQPAAIVPPQHPEPSPEPTRIRDSRPKAIDMIPMHVPTIPRKKYPPLPEEDSIPEIDGDGLSPQTGSVQGMSRAEIEALIKEIIGESIPDTPTIGANEPSMAKISQINNRIDTLESKLDRSFLDIKRNLEKTNKDSEFKRIEREMEKVSEKVIDIMEDSGYGESLSVAKIPPTILEIVYQAILDDIHIEIVKTKGPQDAERVARSALEEVRLKTSGSELFKFDGRKIVTDSLAKSIEGNMISARQIQTTYDVLLDKLLKTVPHHKAKNFKGMIKVKSQEFAVDRATKLTKEFNKFEKVVESTNQMVAAMAANFSTRNLELHEMMNEMKDNTLATKADQQDIDELKSKVQDLIERNIRLADELALLKAEMEMKAQIKSHDETPAQESSEFLLAPGEIPFPDISDTATGDAQASRDDANTTTGTTDGGNNELILVAVKKGLSSKTAIMKDTDLEEAVVIQALARLVEQRKLIETKIGKRLKYSTLEQELDLKLKAGQEKPVEKVSSKKDKVSTKKAPDEEPASGMMALEPAPSILPPETEKKPLPEYDFKRLEPSKPKKKGKRSKGTAEPPEQVDSPAQSAEDKIVSKKPQPAKKEISTASKKTKGKLPKSKEEPVPLASKEERPDKGQDKPMIEPEPEKERPSPETVKQSVKDPAMETIQAPPEEPARIDDLPVIKKTLAELSNDEVNVLEAISEDGMTVSGIQSKVGKHIKRFALLRALRVLIDSGHVGILTKGRLELYQKIKVQKIDKMKQDEKQKEVK